MEVSNELAQILARRRQRADSNNVLDEKATDKNGIVRDDSAVSKEATLNSQKEKGKEEGFDAAMAVPPPASSQSSTAGIKVNDGVSVGDGRMSQVQMTKKVFNGMDKDRSAPQSLEHPSEIYSSSYNNKNKLETGEEGESKTIVLHGTSCTNSKSKFKKDPTIWMKKSNTGIDSAAHVQKYDEMEGLNKPKWSSRNVPPKPSSIKSDSVGEIPIERIVPSKESDKLRWRSSLKGNMESEGQGGEVTKPSWVKSDGADEISRSAAVPSGEGMKPSRVKHLKDNIASNGRSDETEKLSCVKIDSVDDIPSEASKKTNRAKSLNGSIVSEGPSGVISKPSWVKSDCVGEIPMDTNIPSGNGIKPDWAKSLKRSIASRGSSGDLAKPSWIKSDSVGEIPMDTAAPKGEGIKPSWAKSLERSTASEGRGYSVTRPSWIKDESNSNYSIKVDGKSECWIKSSDKGHEAPDDEVENEVATKSPPSMMKNSTSAKDIAKEIETSDHRSTIVKHPTSWLKEKDGDEIRPDDEVESQQTRTPETSNKIFAKSCENDPDFDVDSASKISLEIEDESNDPLDSWNDNGRIDPNGSNVAQTGISEAPLDASVRSSLMGSNTLVSSEFGNEYTQEQSSVLKSESMDSFNSCLHLLSKTLFLPRGLLPVIADINKNTGGLVFACSDEGQHSNNRIYLVEAEVGQENFCVTNTVQVHSLDLEKKCAQHDICNGETILSVDLMNIVVGGKRLCAAARLMTTSNESDPFEIMVILVYSWATGVLQAVFPQPRNSIFDTLCVTDGMIFIASSEKKMYASKVSAGTFIPVVTSEQKIKSMEGSDTFKSIVVGCEQEILVFSYGGLTKRKDRILNLTNRYPLNGACLQISVNPMLPFILTATTSEITVYDIEAKGLIAVKDYTSISNPIHLRWLEHDIPTFAVLSSAALDVLELAPNTSNEDPARGTLKSVYSEDSKPGLLHILPGFICQYVGKFVARKFTVGFEEEVSVPISDHMPVPLHAGNILSDSGGFCERQDDKCVYILSKFDRKLYRLRHWLCMTTCFPDETNNREDEDDNGFTFGGAKSELLCEMKFPSSDWNLIPCDLRRNRNLVVIMLKVDRFAQDCSCFLVYQIQSRQIVCAKTFARDVAFIDETNLLLLSPSGDSISYKNILTSSLLHDSHSTELSGGLVGKRIFYITQKIYIVASNGDQQCLIRGNSEESNLIFDYGESVLNMKALATSTCFALATNQRVIIFNQDLMKISEYRGNIECATTCGLGSHCVAFLDFSGNSPSLRYLNCLTPSTFSTGVICNLPKSSKNQRYSLLQLTSDRLVYFDSSEFVCHSHDDEIEFPMAITQPLASLLEPFVCNALCFQNENILREVINKFGRKHSHFPHKENEGIGCKGIGLTDTVYEALLAHQKVEAAKLLLLGTTQLSSASTAKVLPEWLPSSIRKKLLNDPDLVLPCIGGYTGRRARNIMSMSLALSSLSAGDVTKAIAYLQYSGHEDANRVLIELLLNREADDIGMESLDILATQQNQTGKFAKLLLQLREKQRKREDNRSDEERKDIDVDFDCILPISNCDYNEFQTSAITQHLTEQSNDEAKQVNNDKWNTPLQDSHHVWNKGESNSHKQLLALNTFDEWLGRRRPQLLENDSLGGEQTLRNILAASEIDDINESQNVPGKYQWVDGVGEGRDDMDFVSAYFRFSEGASEEVGEDWITVNDLSKHNHRGLILGAETIRLEETTCGVDEGEESKVKQPFDLVFENNESEIPRALFLDICRGNSLDVGILHAENKSSRKSCSIEFWFNTASVENGMNSNVSLMRRTLSSHGKDVSKLCFPEHNEGGCLWELILLTSGHLEFRTNMSSVSTAREMEQLSIISWQRDDGFGGWNHVCLTMTSKDMDPLETNIIIYVKGEEVLRSSLSFSPPDGDIDEYMSKSALLFGLGATAGFRMTELRVWSRVRDKEDIQRDMFEYLSLAERKSKFRFKIRNKQNVGISASPLLTTLKISPLSQRHLVAPRGKSFTCDFDKQLEDHHSLSLTSEDKIFDDGVSTKSVGQTFSFSANENSDARDKDLFNSNAVTSPFSWQDDGEFATNTFDVNDDEPMIDWEDTEIFNDTSASTKGVPELEQVSTVEKKFHSFKIESEMFPTSDALVEDGLRKAQKDTADNGVTVDSFYVPENESAIIPPTNNSTSVNFDKDSNKFQNGFTDSGVIMDKFDVPESENVVFPKNNYATNFGFDDLSYPLAEKYNAGPTVTKATAKVENDCRTTLTSAQGTTFDFDNPTPASNQSHVAGNLNMFPKDPRVDEKMGFANDFIPQNTSIDSAASKNLEITLSASFSFEVYGPLSKEAGLSAAAAIVRGPPAARHFGGNNGGFVLSNRKNIGCIAVCGSEKTILFNALEDPPSRIYSVGASGAIITKTPDETEYMCCFAAGSNLLTVIDVDEQLAVASQQMTTKLNFWRCLPSEAHGSDVTFMLVTPAGGFHWMPLAKDSRPRRMWKRSAELQDKRIISYEEGGNNGFSGRQSRSTIALVLTTPKSILKEDNKLEAWCLLLGSNIHAIPLCVSTNIQGCSFFRPPSLGADDAPFRPLICMVQQTEENGHEIILKLSTISKIPPDRKDGPTTLALDEVCVSRLISVKDMRQLSCPEHMIMGHTPYAIILCHNDFIVLILRRFGVIVLFSFDDGELSYVGRTTLEHYVIDATVREAEDKSGIEVVVLTGFDGEDLNERFPDGNIILMHVSQKGIF